jgi:hypothetical protein
MMNDDGLRLREKRAECATLFRCEGSILAAVAFPGD